MRIGLRLRWLESGQGDFTLGDLLDFIEHATPEMAIYRALNKDAQWGLPEQLLASMFEHMQMKSWVEGGKKGPKPKPIPRPGVTDTEETRYTTSKRSTVIEIDEWLAAKRRSA